MGKTVDTLGGRWIAAWLKSLGGRGGKPMEKPITQVDTAVLTQYEGKYRYVDYPENCAEIIKDGEYIFISYTFFI